MILELIVSLAVLGVADPVAQLPRGPSDEFDAWVRDRCKLPEPATSLEVKGKLDGDAGTAVLLRGQSTSAYHEPFAAVVVLEKQTCTTWHAARLPWNEAEWRLVGWWRPASARAPLLVVSQKVVHGEEGDAFDEDSFLVLGAGMPAQFIPAGGFKLGSFSPDGASSEGVGKASHRREWSGPATCREIRCELKPPASERLTLECTCSGPEKRRVLPYCFVENRVQPCAKP